MSFYTEIAGLIPPPANIDDTHKDYSIGIAVIILGIVASLTVFIRLIHRFSSKNQGVDDYAVIPAVAVFIAWTGLAAHFILNGGIGKPLGEVTYGEFIVFYEGILVSAWIYPVMSALIRISILLFYRRLFAKGSPWASVAIWVLLVLQVLYAITFVVIPGFDCHPISDFYEPIKRLTSCTDLYITSTIGLYSVSLAFDIILLVLPLRLIWNLQMSFRKKAGISVILIIGSGAIIAASYKLGIFADTSVDWTPTDPNWFTYQASAYIPPQFTAYGTTFWIPTQFEPTVALIGTSVPAMLQAFSALSLQFSRIRSRLSGRSGAPSSGDAYTDQIQLRNRSHSNEWKSHETIPRSFDEGGPKLQSV